MIQFNKSFHNSSVFILLKLQHLLPARRYMPSVFILFILSSCMGHKTNNVSAYIKHLEWDATVDFEHKVLYATAKLHLTPHTSGTLILNTKQLNIFSVTDLTGEKLHYALLPYDSIFGQDLEVNVTRATEAVIVHYQTQPGAEALQWLNPQQTSGKVYPFLFTQSQAILARSWIPLQDKPSVRFTYSARVKVPAHLMALMSAENPQQKNDSGIYHFEMRHPIPSYLMALAVGDLQYKTIGKTTGIYAEPAMIGPAYKEFEHLDEMLHAAENLYGPYLWDRYDLLVLPPSFPFGGMENPRLTFVTPTIITGDHSLTSLIAHELAHSWSGNLVTNATWEDFWLNEGFTVYFERRIMEAIYGLDYANMLSVLGQNELEDEIDGMQQKNEYKDTRLKLDLSGRNPDEGVTAIAYEKGYFFLKYLENLVGRRRLDQFIKEYFKVNAFHSITTEEFLIYLKQHLFANNLIEYPEEEVNKWVYTPGLPHTMPAISATLFQKIDAEALQWLQNTSYKVDTARWSAHEWLYFLEIISDDLDREKAMAIQETYHLFQSSNAEIFAKWAVITIKFDLPQADVWITPYLIKTGRRKFLAPIYTAYTQVPGGLERARSIYKEARPNYHYVARNTIDTILGM